MFELLHDGPKRATLHVCPTPGRRPGPQPAATTPESWRHSAFSAASRRHPLRLRSIIHLVIFLPRARPSPGTRRAVRSWSTSGKSSMRCSNFPTPAALFQGFLLRFLVPGEKISAIFANRTEIERDM